MIIGFVANISNDVDRIFLTRLAECNIQLNSTKSKTPYEYAFIVVDYSDLPQIRGIRKVMVKTYGEINVPTV